MKNNCIVVTLLPDGTTVNRKGVYEVNRMRSKLDKTKAVGFWKPLTVKRILDNTLIIRRKISSKGISIEEINIQLDKLRRYNTMLTYIRCSSNV